MQNVFLEKQVAEAFENATYIPESSLVAIGEFVFDNLVGSRSSPDLQGADLGSGTGRSILGLVSGILRHAQCKAIYCVEVSEAMIAKLQDRVYQDSRMRDIVKVCQHDLNEQPPQAINQQSLDFITIVSVLHYLCDWRTTIGLYSKCLRGDGTLVLAEIVGWYRLLDGTFDQGCLTDDGYSFWKEYFRLRAEKQVWNPEVAFSRMKSVYDYCSSSLRMKVINTKEFQWDCHVQWRDVLDWIRLGVVSSLGSGLTSAERGELSDSMKIFLQERKIDLGSSFNASWGMRITCFRKE